MKSEEEEETMNMTEEELNIWLRKQVEKNHLVKQRRAQLAQVEEWVKKKESEALYTKTLYNNTYQSVLECESVLKDLHGLLGLEYRDTDSEAEDGGPKSIENADGLDKRADECGTGAGDNAAVANLGAAVPVAKVKEEPKEVELSAGVEFSKVPFPTLVQKVEKVEPADPLTQVKLASPSTPRKTRDSGDPVAAIKTFGSPVPISTPSSSDFSVCSLKREEESRPVSSGTPLRLNETVETLALPTTIPVAASDPVRVETPSEASAPTKHHTETPAQPVAPTPTSARPATPANSTKYAKTDSAATSKSSKTTTSTYTAGKTTTKEKVKVASTTTSPPTTTTTSPPKTTTSPPNTTVSGKAKEVDPVQSDKPPVTKAPPSSTQSNTTNTTASDQTAKTTTSTNTPVTPTSPPTTVPARVQLEVKLKVNMSVLGRRRTKTWHKGTILDIKSTDSGPRYKILFDGGKGKSVLSAHHLACVGPPMLKDLFVGSRVVSLYKEDNQSWLHAAVIAEMPDRKNRMRFLVFFDDGRPAYIGLPDLHVVCKPLSNMTDDIEDEVWRAEVEEYLQAYPNPVFVVMRVGEDCKVKRNGRLEQCNVTQVDGSLIEVRYKSDDEKEWLYKGSNRMDQIQRIKKRMEEQKKDHSVNKAGWIQPQKIIRPPTTCPTSTVTSSTSTTASSTSTPAATSTTTAPSITNATATTAIPASATATPNSATASTTVATNIQPLKTPPPPPPSVSQPVSAVTSSSSSSSAIKTVDGMPISQPRVVLHRISMQLKTENVKPDIKSDPAKPVIKTDPAKPVVKTDPAETDLSYARIKEPPSDDDEEDTKYKIASSSTVEPRLKYVPHRCCPACLNQVRPMQRDQNRGRNPLLIPLLHGFRRMTARRRVDGKMSFHVFYRAPCGRSLCEMEELQAFLFESRCDFLFLDMFCLDPFVLVKRASLPSAMTSRPFVLLPDISGGKELVPVPCVNDINTICPPALTYTTHRLPSPGVFINTNLDFMVGCDCTDGCRDRSKCACYQMTIEATSLFTGGPVDVTAGYTHKRLPRYVPTGVYECNPLCRCDPLLCSNRLVQHGLQLRLEVFMTQHKGWGLRCLDDVSKGTFVCAFTGKVVKEELIAEGSMTGNEYLANLDYIEGVEKLKEGYESDAYSSDAEEESDKKTLVRMTTGALKKHAVFTIDSSSSGGEEKEERRRQKKVEPICKRKRKACDSDWEDDDDDDSEDEDDVDDEDYKLSSDDYVGTEWKYNSDRIYSTRRNAKIPEKKDLQTSSTISEEHTEVTASMAKKMRREGPGERKLGFAKKSTRPFAIKSSHSRVKSPTLPETSAQDKKVSRGRRCTRSMFNGEKACYLIDAKQEGNLARFINHSCSPNLFVQNVFVDTHDLRFPWVVFFSSKRIRAGTELTWDYSYEVGSVEGKVLLCCCGSAECTGRLL